MSKAVNIIDKKTKELIASVDFKEKNIILKAGYEIARNGEKIIILDVEGKS